MKKTPMRRCVGCMESKPKNSLVRIVSYEGNIAVDWTGKANGRGVYVCPDEACIEKAYKRKSLSRSLGVPLSEETLGRVFQELRDGRS